MPGEYLKSEGDFLVVAEKPNSGWLGQSKEKKTPYIQIRFRVEDGADQGKEITWFGYLSDKAIENTADTLAKVFGFNGDLNALYAGKQTLEGMQARITVEAEEYEGKQRFKVKWLNPADYDGPPAIDDDTAKALIAGLNKRMMGAAKLASAAAPAPPAKHRSQGAPPAAQDPGDDVPF